MNEIHSGAVSHVATASHAGPKTSDRPMAKNRTQRMNVPTAGAWKYSSACWVKCQTLAGKMIAVGDVSTNTTTWPSARWAATTSGRSVSRARETD